MKNGTRDFPADVHFAPPEHVIDYSPLILFILGPRIDISEGHRACPNGVYVLQRRENGCRFWG